MLSRVLPKFCAFAAWLSLHPTAVAHYTCANDEVAGEVQGETGLVCGPKCGAGNLECPMDVPEGTTAQPQCMLQDVDQVAYCGLLCQVDTQCPSGSACRRVGQPEVGLCIHGLSFAEWAREGTRRKLAVSVPARPGSSSKGAAIAKAVQALQNLKKRYSIGDGDADVLVVKELLSAATTASISGSPGNTAMFATGGQGIGVAAAGPASNVPPPVPANSPAPAPSPQASSWNPFARDVQHFAGYLKDGVPGLEREAHDIVWNVEHINQRGKATELLRGFILVACVYLGIGAAYKYQTEGARGTDMVPHVGFWKEYPQLVADGMRYASMIIGDLVGKHRGGGGGGFQQMGTGDRDTFAHFEPSK